MTKSGVGASARRLRFERPTVSSATFATQLARQPPPDGVDDQRRSGRVWYRSGTIRSWR